MHITWQKWQSGDMLLNNRYDFVSAAHSPQQTRCRHMWTGLGISKNRNRLNFQIWTIILTIRIWLKSKHEIWTKEPDFPMPGADCHLSHCLAGWPAGFVEHPVYKEANWSAGLSACTAFTDDLSIYIGIFAVTFANVPTKYQSPSNWCGSCRGYLRAQKPRSNYFTQYTQT